MIDEYVIKLPKALAKHLEGLDVESIVTELLLQKLSLNPDEEAEVHAENSKRFLEEGVSLVDKEPVQASEKLYKAAEECVKALALHLNLSDIVKKAKERGRWTATELEKSVLKISEKLGEWFRQAWDTAWTLHVWGFHEAKFDSEDVKTRLLSIEKMVEEARKILRRNEASEERPRPSSKAHHFDHAGLFGKPL